MADDTVMTVLMTAPDRETGRSVAARLVEERLAACGNVLEGVTSVFWWEGAVQDEPEVLVILKTTRAHADRLTERIREVHPYDVPEVLALPVERGLQEYMDWVRDETGPTEA